MFGSAGSIDISTPPTEIGDPRFLSEFRIDNEPEIALVKDLL